VEDSDLKAVRAQTAIVRTVADAARRDAGGSDSEVLREQAVAESARLVSTVRDLLKHRSEHPAQNAAPESGPAAVEETRRRILVVEDDGEARSAIATFLAYEYEVVTACDGAEGLVRAAHGDLDAIVSDVRMPNVDGIKMVEEIRRRGGAPIPVIFLTAETDAERIAAAFSAGGTTYLGKPVDLDLLAQELRWTLGREAGTET